MAALAAGMIAGVLFLPRLLDRPRSPTGRVSRVLAKGGTALSAGICDARALVRSGSPLVIAGAAGYMALAYRAFQLGLPALLGALAVIRLPGVVRSAPDVCEPAAKLRVRGARPSAGSVRPVGVATS